MNRIEKDIELAKSQISELVKQAKRKGFSTINNYIIEYGERANNVRYNYLSVENIIDSKETNALYTANWVKGGFVVKVLGPYTQEEVEGYGWEYDDYHGIRNVALVKWDGKFQISSSTLTNGWSPSVKGYGHQVYKIKPLESYIFMNWNSNPLNS